MIIFKKFLSRKKLTNTGSSIARRISYGYILAIGIATVGTTIGLITGEHYQKKAQKELFFADYQKTIIYQLENNVSTLRFHPQQLIDVVEDSIWLQYEQSKFSANIDQIQTNLSDLADLIDSESDNMAVDTKTYLNLIKDYKQTVDDYSQLMISLWQQIDSPNLRPEETSAIQQKILMAMQSQEATQVGVRFERISEQLIRIKQIAGKQYQQADLKLTQANLLRLEIIILSTLLSVGMALLLAEYTSRAIARPIQEVTQIAKQVTQESNFHLQAPISSKDEVGVLANALNKLIDQVRELLEAQQAEVTRQKRQSQELAKAKEAADAASKAKSEFLANMSHELRTPLNGVLGYAQILKRTPNLTPRQTKGLEIIEQSGQHLLTLINDILDLAKIEARKLELNPSEINLFRCLCTVVDIVRMRAIDKDLLFDYISDSTLPKIIQTDEKRLRQILLNLLSNAIKFTDRGRVTFTVKQIDHSAELKKVTLHFAVRDTGVGIRPEELAKIFQPFEQVGEKERRAEGTGLGLTITRQLVELMGGQLQVDSQWGEGSTFWFEASFPIVNSSTTTEIKATVVGYRGPHYRLLVVDDRVENLLVLENLLTPLGFEVVTANDGEQAIALADKICPNLILLDLVMPKLNGWETAARMRKIPSLTSVPIIAVSASISEEVYQKSEKSGCNAFLSKPVELNRLLELLAQYLSLEWVYSEEVEAVKGEQDNKSGSEPEVFMSNPTQTEQPLVVPPPDEIQQFYELALLGNMKKIRERAKYFKELDPKYLLFADKILDLASRFQEKAIVALIKQYLSHDN